MPEEGGLPDGIGDEGGRVIYFGLLSPESGRNHKRIIKTAQTFLLENTKYERHDLRFDVISMDGNLDKL